jgi:O-antigen/teichoic acid export membrane protein
MMQDARRWLSDPSLWRAITAGGCRVFSTVLGVIVNVLLARSVQLSTFGQLQFAISFLGLATAFAGAGHGRLAQRKVAQCLSTQNHRELHAFLGTATRQVVASAAIVGTTAILVFLLTWIFPIHVFADPRIWMGLAITIPVLAILELLSGIALGGGRVLAGIAPRTLIQPAIFACLLVTASLANMEITTFVAYLFFFSSLLAAMIVAVLSNPEWLKHFWAYDRGHAKEWRDSAMHFSWFSLFMIAVLQGDILLMGFLAPADETGAYALAARIAGCAIIPLSLLTSSMAHELAGAFASKNHEGVNRTLFRIGFWSLVLGSPVLIAMVCIPGFLVSLFNPAYFTSAFPLQILAAAQLVHIIGSPSITHLGMTHLERQSRNAMFCGLATNLTSGLILIPWLGSVGAAVSCLLGTLVWSGMGIWIAYRRTGFLTPFFLTRMNLRLASTGLINSK